MSVDAATKDSLKAIDRPLFSDFWERFVVSIHTISNESFTVMPLKVLAHAAFLVMWATFLFQFLFLVLFLDIGGLA